jgi:hypothetical protein|eukprot:CAMPEP_0181182744 /NCGR_PEP_ID=MMETSP1096-20121128/8051_1 /TAXON_ID=156174 ORGANISM="Chrysochromulina ericina, Strain CCMP281" /NCGR_SAMPLE_ID=MMETSP1096 /ASSEMBLY_ACC=CAM_ASM_000453 /LENGTH=67 /DNA_ID=CAMNT_0023271369 /DNA_START=46 /DNA_END=249 /DNA_ORIENTATION=-
MGPDRINHTHHDGGDAKFGFDAPLIKKIMEEQPMTTNGSSGEGCSGVGCDATLMEQRNDEVHVTIAI